MVSVRKVGVKVGNMSDLRELCLRPVLGVAANQ